MSRKHVMGKRLDNGMGWVDWSGPLYLSHINAGSRSSFLEQMVIFTKFLPSKVHFGELKSCQLGGKTFFLLPVASLEGSRFSHIFEHLLFTARCFSD